VEEAESEREYDSYLSSSKEET